MQTKSTPPRRDFVVGAALAFSAVGLGFAVYPFVAQMAPNPSSPRDTIDIDLSGIRVGAERQYVWKGKPILIRHRTSDEIKAMQAVRMEDLIDPVARVDGYPTTLPASDANRFAHAEPRWLVIVGLCTKEGCILKPVEASQPRDLVENWTCLCCASRFDASGRVRKGPAAQNLAVPPYRLIAKDRIEIG